MDRMWHAQIQTTQKYLDTLPDTDQKTWTPTPASPAADRRVHEWPDRTDPLGNAWTADASTTCDAVETSLVVRRLFTRGACPVSFGGALVAVTPGSDRAGCVDRSQVGEGVAAPESETVRASQ